jgi:hypothetical protein
MLGTFPTYLEVAGLYCGVDTLEDVGEGEVGSGGEGVYLEERVR